MWYGFIMNNDDIACLSDCMHLFSSTKLFSIKKTYLQASKALAGSNLWYDYSPSAGGSSQESISEVLIGGFLVKLSVPSWPRNVLGLIVSHQGTPAPLSPHIGWSVVGQLICMGRNMMVWFACRVGTLTLVASVVCIFKNKLAHVSIYTLYVPKTFVAKIL